VQRVHEAWALGEQAEAKEVLLVRILQKLHKSPDFQGGGKNTQKNTSLTYRILSIFEDKGLSTYTTRHFFVYLAFFFLHLYVEDNVLSATLHLFFFFT